jgi:uncharacterized membrane protein YoaK (UPF0700 family)
MSAKPTPLWITLGAVVLSLVAGYVNAVGFLGIHHQGLSHVTGQVTLVSIRLAEGDATDAYQGVTVGLWFFAGAVLSGVIIKRAELSLRGRRYGVAMVVEGALLALGTGLLVRGSDRGEYLAAMACGLQNAMATSYSGSVLRTTHMTGVVTDLGILIGHWLRREPLETKRLKLLAILFGGFLLGGVLGALASVRFGPWALGVPGTVMLITGAGFILLGQLRPRERSVGLVPR